MLSAVITHYFIGVNNDAINVIDRDINNKQVLIDSLWQSMTESERKKEFFILLLSNKNGKSAINETYYRDYLSGIMKTYELNDFQTRLESNSGNDLNLLFDLSNAAQVSIVETINATYFETLELQKARMPLERDNSLLFSIAIFLQVIGLILVLSRDLW
ncbi:MAG: hypothetical protein GY935_19330 [Gammaproteobacteria bacterium]|nr:hypothetical protein [Gammaproteobacteria bacterium]